MLGKTDELKKADAAHESIENRPTRNQKQDELESNSKTGWENLDDTVRAKLHGWLEKDKD